MADFSLGYLKQDNITAIITSMSFIESFRMVGFIINIKTIIHNKTLLWNIFWAKLGKSDLVYFYCFQMSQSE